MYNKSFEINEMIYTVSHKNHRIEKFINVHDKNIYTL